MSRAPGRFLITVGSPDVPQLGLPPLRRVASDVRRVQSFFTDQSQQYQLVLNQIALGASAGAIRSSISRWFSDEERREDDCVVVYVAGHGDVGDKFTEHYLFTRDSNRRDADSMLRTADVPRWFFGGEGSRPQNVLLILDVCYAGQGAGESASELIGAQARILRGGAGFWVLATSDPNTEAGDGMFVDALMDVVRDEAWMPRGGVPFLSPADLATAVNELWIARHEPQRVLFYTIAGGRVPAPFIRNPQPRPELDGLSVADQAHWESKARGVDIPGTLDWYFTGRTAALRFLSDWLEAPVSDGRARVVTGRPGSGKSAVLGWLVLATHSRTRDVIERSSAAVDRTWMPRAGAVNARVHARGAHLGGVVSTLADSLGVDARNVAELLAAVNHLRGPIGILIDSLDEAAEPEAIARELLSELVVCPPVRLIVGSRRMHDRVPLADVAEIVDLDDPRYFSRKELTDYAFQRLTATSLGAAYTSTEGHAAARLLSDLVAERAGHSFLYARLVTRALARASRAVDTTVEDWQQQLSLPHDIAEAFGSDLERFDGPTRNRLIDMLVPLAYCRGRGLPQKHVWHTVTSRIAGQPYSNADLHDLKTLAGYYLVRDTEAGEAVFRLFHETFASYLRDRTQHDDVERSFAEALLELVPTAPAGVDSWSQVTEPYVLNHLPSHLARAGLLDTHIKDPGLLLSVSSEALLVELPRVASAEGRRIAAAYRKASHWIGGHHPAAARYLLWAALEQGVQGLADALRARIHAAPWSPEWTVHQVSTSSYVLGQTAEAVRSIATGRDEQGQAVVISGHVGGVIRAWDLATRELRLEHAPRRLRQKQTASGYDLGAPVATHVDIGRHRDQVVILAAWDEGSFGVLDLHGNELGWCDTFNMDNAVTALHIVHLGNDAVAVTATEDGALRVRALPTLDLLHECRAASASWIYSLAATSYEGEAAVVAGADAGQDNPSVPPWLIRIWSVDGLRLLWQAPEMSYSSMPQVIACIVEGVPWIIGREGSNGVLLMTPPADVVHEVAGRHYAGISQIAGLWRTEREVALLGVHYSQLRAFSIRPGSTAGAIEPHIEPLPVDVEVRGVLWSDVVELRDRPTLVSIDGPYLRVWDVQELLAPPPPSAPEGFDLQGGSVSALTARDGWIAVGSTSGNIWFFDTAGRLHWKRRISPLVRALAIEQVRGGLAVIALSESGRLFTLAASDGIETGPPLEVGHKAWALSVRAHDGKPIAFVAVNLNPIAQESRYVAAAWDLDTRRQVHEAHRADLPWQPRTQFDETRVLWCVQAKDWNGQTMVALAGAHGEVCTTAFGSAQLDHWRGGEFGVSILALALATDHHRLLAYGGDESGRLFGRDVTAKQPLPRRVDAAHSGRVRTLMFVNTAAGACLVSGGEDGLVRIWSPDLTPGATIDAERAIRGLAAVGDDRLVIATDRGLTVLKVQWPQLMPTRI